MPRFILACLMLLVPSLSFAADAPLEKVGTARLRVLFMNVYDATLYAPGGKYNADQPHALELQYLMNFTSDEIVDRSLEEMADAGALPEAKKAAWKKQLQRVIPDVKKNDRLRAIVTPGKGMAMRHNGATVGRVADEALVRSFMNIWLGPKTNEPALRDKLLGKE